MAADANPTKEIRVWANDHAEFMGFCNKGGWIQPGLFRTMLECWKETEAARRIQALIDAADPNATREEDNRG